ncbi:universal stress protein [Dehalogenimonas alkenigignens]|uniref:Universal stress protein UspA or related nucleotide-binding protein n=1 Tax=Dehalogenimonas alkenigignens TaxID=1217799 RepID=A0A0W0GJL9_9CHLR|nr:universal stress protein [Dehalogenimonas alkenigignens]KTB48756.1 Universal stress protein UspA or related nucleotide-binding protein [Dehalogenimonas alkenigignens]
MYRKLLVPLDGSELSETILPQVAAVAKPASASVVLLRVRESLDRGVRQTLGDDIAEKLDTVNREEIQSYLDRIAGDLIRDGIAADIAIAEGNPAEAIINYASTHAVDLIVMATHGRGGLTRWAFGSVADKVLRQSPVPVLLGPVTGSRA